MLISKKARIHISIVSIFLFFIISFAVYSYYQEYKIISKYEEKREDEYRQIEESYKKNPNGSDAYNLLEYYIDKEEWNEVLFYGESCLKFGAHDKAVGGRIHFFIARAYYEINNKEMAKKYLKIASEYAIALGNDNFQNCFETAKQYEINKLLSSEEWAHIKNNPDQNKLENHE